MPGLGSRFKQWLTLWMHYRQPVAHTAYAPSWQTSGNRAAPHRHSSEINAPDKKAPNFQPGRPKSDAAPRTMLMAAGKGDAHAMGEIALLYAEVKGCDSTRQWLEKAAIARNETAKRALRSGVVGPCQWYGLLFLSIFALVTCAAGASIARHASAARRAREFR